MFSARKPCWENEKKEAAPLLNSKITVLSERAIEKSFIWNIPPPRSGVRNAGLHSNHLDKGTQMKDNENAFSDAVE